MNLEGVVLSEISQTKKDKQCMISLNEEAKKYNKLVNIAKMHTHRYREQTSDYQLEEGRREGQDRSSRLRGTHVNPWLIHVNAWQKPLQYCKVISLQLIKINEKINQ